MRCGNNPVNLRIVRSDGQEWLLGADTGWGILEDGLEDLNDVEYDVETSANVLTDGSSLVGKRVEEKDRTVTAQYSGSDKPGERGKVLAFLNPRFDFKVYVTYMGRTRWYGGELLKSDVGTGNVNKPMEVTFTILCLDPYLKDTDGNDRSLTDAEPMFGFPFVSILEDDGVMRGFNASRLIFDGKNTVYNNGDVPCMYTIRMEFDGEVKNPSITKDGKTIKILDTMVAGDVIEIDLQSAPPTLEKNGSNAIQLASRDSYFTGMEMQVGANIFTYTMDNTANRSFMHVSILHYEKYLGV